MLKTRNIVFCDFCGKNQFEAKKIVAGATTHICSECIDLCLEVLKEEEARESGATSAETTVSELHKADAPAGDGLMSRMERIELAIAGLTKAAAALKVDISDLNVPRKGLDRFNDPFYCHYPHY